MKIFLKFYYFKLDFSYFLIEKFHSNIKSTFYSRPKSNDLTFSIQHYAGSVEYNVKGFLEKNSDYLSPEIISLLRQSEISLICSLFKNPLPKMSENTLKGHLRYDSFEKTSSTLKNGKTSKKVYFLN